MQCTQCLFQTLRKQLESDHGDPITLLNVFREWLEVKRGERAASRNWCRKRGLEEQRFYEATKLRAQFKDLLQVRFGLMIKMVVVFYLSSFLWWIKMFSFGLCINSIVLNLHPSGQVTFTSSNTPHIIIVLLPDSLECLKKISFENCR